LFYTLFSKHKNTTILFYALEEGDVDDSLENGSCGGTSSCMFCVREKKAKREKRGKEKEKKGGECGRESE
jgi:hypothetical protein